MVRSEGVRRGDDWFMLQIAADWKYRGTQEGHSAAEGRHGWIP
jgi:hypothetical protein